MSEKQPLTDPNEQLIIEALQRGDENAFKTIHAAYGAALFHFSHEIVGRDQEAQDIVTESFVNLWQEKENVFSIENVRGFLYTAARNLSLQTLRNKKRRTVHHQKILALLESAEESVLALIVSAEHRRQLYAAIAMLPDQQRRVIYGSIQEGKSVRELAIELDLGEGTIRSLKSKAVAFLKKQLTGLGITILLILLNLIYLAKKIIS